MVALEVAPGTGDGHGWEAPAWTEDVDRPGHATVIEIAGMNIYSLRRDETLGRLISTEVLSIIGW